MLDSVVSDNPLWAQTLTFSRTTPRSRIPSRLADVVTVSQKVSVFGHLRLRDQLLFVAVASTCDLASRASCRARRAAAGGIRSGDFPDCTHSAK